VHGRLRWRGGGPLVGRGGGGRRGEVGLGWVVGMRGFGSEHAEGEVVDEDADGDDEDDEDLRGVRWVVKREGCWMGCQGRVVRGCQ